MSQDDLQVNLLGVKLNYSLYVKIQILIVVILSLAGFALRALSDSENVILSNAWWVCLAWIPIEIIEAIVATRMAKKNQAKEQLKGSN